MARRGWEANARDRLAAGVVPSRIEKISPHSLARLARKARWLEVALLGLACLYWAQSISPLRAEIEPSEGPPLVFSHMLVPEELRSGERYQLGPIGHVVNFGYEFELYSDFGEYQVRGIDMLEKRVNEIHALERLEEISKTDAFAKSFSEALKNPLVRTWTVARKPISTVVGIPGGVVRYLQGKFYEVKKGSRVVATKANPQNFQRGDSRELDAGEPSEGTVKKVGSATKKLSRRHLGFDRAKRDWARRLKVDPYSTNDHLQYELERIAWASSVGSFAAEFAMPPSAVLSYTLQAQELVWSKSELELERLNSIALKNMGLESDVILIFNDLDHYTLTEKTELVLTLDELDVEGRLELVRLLLEVQSREEALLMVKIVSVFGNYSQLVQPLHRLEVRRGLAVAVSEEGSIILPLALDYLHWAPELTDSLLSEEMNGASRELWISGTASSIAKRQLALNKWGLRERCFEAFSELRTSR